jgi:hypothetical protein
VISGGCSAVTKLPTGGRTGRKRPSVVRPLTRSDHQPAQGNESSLTRSGFGETLVRMQRSRTGLSIGTASTERWRGFVASDDAFNRCVATALRLGRTSFGVESECRRQPTRSAPLTRNGRRERAGEVMRQQQSNMKFLNQLSIERFYRRCEFTQNYQCATISQAQMQDACKPAAKVRFLDPKWRLRRTS